MTTHKLETAVFAQGWIEGQIESSVERLNQGTDREKELGGQLAEMWAVVNTTMDELIKENQALKAKLDLIVQAVNS